MNTIQNPCPLPAVRPTPVAIYTRVSTASQVGGRFDSCESQAAICRDYLRRHANEGWFEVACYRDEGVSGGTLDRPGIRALKRQIETGEAKLVLIYKFERILRSTDEWASFRTFLSDHDCRLVSTSEAICEDTPSGRLKNNLLVSVAEYERLNTAEKVRTKMLEQAKRGFWNYGQTPFGYNYDRKAQMLHPNPDEAVIVSRIYADAARLVPLFEIAQALDKEGIRTRLRTFRRKDGSQQKVGGRLFRPDTLRNLIRNPIYAGRVRFNGQEFMAVHSPVVTPEIWECANAAVARLKQPAPRVRRASDKQFHLLKGLIQCGSCGRPMVPHSSGKRDANGNCYRYYSCVHRNAPESTEPCSLRQVSAGILETVVVEFIGECSRQPEAVADVTEQSNRRAKTAPASLRSKLAAIDRSIVSLNQQIRRCIDAVCSNKLESLNPELFEEANALKIAKQRAIVEREQLRQDIAACDEPALNAASVLKALERFSELLKFLSAEEQRYLVFLLIERIEVHAFTERTRDRAGTCGFAVKLWLRLQNLVEGMNEQIVTRPHRPFGSSVDHKMTIKIRVETPSARTDKPIVILSPIHFEIPRHPENWRAPSIQVLPRNPLQRALEWQRQLESETGLSRIEIARREKIAPATVTHHLKLLQLHPEIRSALLKSSTGRELRIFSLNRMKALAALAGDDQLREFQQTQLVEPKRLAVSNFKRTTLSIQ